MNKPRKDILDELLYREISKCDEMCEIFERLKIVEIPPKGFISESQLYCWMESTPSIKEKKQILQALGYDVSRL